MTTTPLDTPLMTDPLKELASLATKLAKAHATASNLEERRTELLRELHRQGVPVLTLCETAGISRPRLYQLLGPVETKRKPGGPRKAPEADR